MQPDPDSVADDSMPELRRRPRRSELKLWHSRRRIHPQRAGAFGLSAGVAVDLRLGWDLGQRGRPGESREEVERRETAFAHFESRVLVSLSLDCNTPSKRHLEFACSLAELQIEHGGRVLLEFPLAASEEPCLWKLRSIDGMRCVRYDQCQFGLTSVG